ncbi:MAG: hypothetical protein KH377_11300 [[Eubacterium] siraeum]|nr:hypothetical protein [[Eubacterium] siraeum]
MKYSEFVLKNIGHKIDFDRCYGVQCVDLINQYMTDVLDIKVTYFPPFAKNFWNDRKKSKFLIKNFDFLRPKNQKNIDKEHNKVVESKLKESPCKQFKTNAYMTADSRVYSNNTKENITGFVNKNEKVKMLAKGDINSIIQYGVDKKIYKVGIVPTKSIKKL